MNTFELSSEEEFGSSNKGPDFGSNFVFLLIGIAIFMLLWIKIS